MDITNQEKQIITLLLFGCVVLFSFLYIRNYKAIVVSPSIVSIPEVTPTPTPFAPRITTVVAPDGEKTLTMRQQQQEDGVLYTFSTSETRDPQTKEILTAKVDLGTILSIPFNTWSPDNNYIFLKSTTATESSFFVLSSSGKPLKQGTQTAKITELFYKRYQDYAITDITGWAGPTLVVINTDKKDGGIGPSFWFDVPSESFIKLSTRFN